MADTNTSTWWFFSTTGRIAYILGIIAGAILFIIGRVRSNTDLTVIGIVFAAFCLLLFLVSYLTGDPARRAAARSR